MLCHLDKYLSWTFSCDSLSLLGSSVHLVLGQGIVWVTAEELNHERDVKIPID